MKLMSKGWREREVIGNTEQQNRTAGGDRCRDGKQDKAPEHRVMTWEIKEDFLSEGVVEQRLEEKAIQNITMMIMSTSECFLGAEYYLECVAWIN